MQKFKPETNIGVHNLDTQTNIAKLSKVQQAFARVEIIGDQLGYGIDEKIKPIVASLLVHGFSTIQSCEGHLERGYPYPSVRICADQPEGWKEATGEQKDLLDKQWIEKNMEQRNKISSLLGEFYKDQQTVTDSNLFIKPMGMQGDFTIQSYGGNKLKKLPVDKKSIKMEQYRKEMNDFSVFLFNKFFSE